MAAVLVMSAVLLGPQCMAQVLTTVEEAGPADCVYIAGNPNLYPIEYYDSEQQCYRGILPELLGIWSVVLLHVWKRNNMISIIGGTLLYMMLVQLVFV